MQKNYFLKTVFTFILCGIFTVSYAADIYLSSTGLDTNDGLTAGTPVASFSVAQTLASSGATIYVSGMIDMWSDPANTTFTAITGGFSTTNKTGVVIAKTLTIQGTSSATDGLQGTNGGNSTRLLQLTNTAYTLTLKNLKLANGKVVSTSVATAGGAIFMLNGNIVAENVIFDGNIATGNSSITGGVMYISGTNATGTTFKNCIFSNNAADKTGAFYINNWTGVIKFEGCSFIANESKLAFGGSALFIRSSNDNNSLSLINCTVAKNKVLNASTNGGAVYPYKGSANTVVNIINTTITENTTAGAFTTSAGVFVLNSAGNYLGKLNISNSIIEGNTAAGGVYADFNTTTTAPTATTLQINNSIIGRQGASVAIPSGCFGATNQFGYLTGTSTTNDFKAGLAPFNATTNSYSLYAGSMAIDYGASSYLTTLTPSVTTDQLGNVRTVAATNHAGAVEAATVAPTTPRAPTALVATAGNGQVSVAFTSAATGGSNVTNYKYSVNGGAFTALDPAATTSPIVIAGLTNNTEYTVKLMAINANGDSPESVESNAVTPTGTTDLANPTTAISISKNANNQLVVNNASQKSGIVSVYNAMGQRIASVTLNASTTTINKAFATGAYMVLVNIDGKTRTTKIIL